MALAVKDVFEQLAADGVVYAEVRFAPLLHLERGLKPAEVVAAVDRAGVPLSISTDTRTITNITLTEEYRNLEEHFGWAPG